MKAIALWDPHRSSSTSLAAFDTLLDETGDPFANDAGDIASCCNPWPDLSESADEYVLKMDVQGMRKSDLDINYGNGRLTVAAHQSAIGKKDARYHHKRVSSGGFTRTFILPDTIDAQRIWAAVRDGVSIIHVPKHKQAIAHEIKME